MNNAPTLNSVAYLAIARYLDNLSLSVSALVCHAIDPTDPHAVPVTLHAIDDDNLDRTCVMHAIVRRVNPDVPVYISDHNASDAYDVTMLDATDVPDDVFLDATAAERLRLIASHV